MQYQEDNMEEEKGYEPIEIKYDMPYVKAEGLSWASTLAEAVQQKYDAFLATQLTLIAKEKGVSVKDLCLRHNDICANIQKIDGDIKFWVEVK